MAHVHQHPRNGAPSPSRGVVLAALISCLLAVASPALASSDRGTFSIVAYDSVTQELGVAVQSKYFSVGTDVPWAEAGVGAIATQARVDPSFGIKGLALLRTGLRAAEVLHALAGADSAWDSRQVGVADAHGGLATWTGSKCLDWAGGEKGADFVCQGNILAGPAVVQGMAKAYQETRSEMAERLLAALEAAQAAGGDKRGMQSAALLVVRPSPDRPQFTQRYVDLRVEDNKTPIQELRRLLEIQEGFHGADNHFYYAEKYAAEGRGPRLARARARGGDPAPRPGAGGEGRLDAERPCLGVRDPRPLSRRRDQGGGACRIPGAQERGHPGHPRRALFPAGERDEGGRGGITGGDDRPEEPVFEGSDRPVPEGERGEAVKPIIVALAVLALAVSPTPARATFSIAAYDSVTQELGVAVQSRAFSVGRAVPWPRRASGPSRPRLPRTRASAPPGSISCA